MCIGSSVSIDGVCYVVVSILIDDQAGTITYRCERSEPRLVRVFNLTFKTTTTEEA